MSRAAWLNGQHGRSCALVLTLFLFQKGQGFFPPLPIAALLPRRWRWADSKESQLGCYGVTWLVLQQKNRLVFFTTVGTMPTQSASLGMLRRGLDILVTQKASGILYPRWSLLRAMRPVAEWRPFLFNKQGNHTRPASREARRRAAVKPRPSSMSASHEARCRMAAFSIQQTRKPHQTGEPRGLLPSGGKTPAKPHIPLRPCAPMARSPGVQGVTPCYTVRVSCSPRRAAFSARRGRMKVERNSSTCWALRPV